MKKNTLRLLFTLAVGSAILFTTGCSKDDTTAPVVTLDGSSSITLSLNSGAWTDPGATANDEEDGATSVTSDASSSNPNVNHTGVYTITYSSTDAAGNVGTAIRTITVKNDAEAFAGIYEITDVTDPTDTLVFNDTITVDETTNNKLHFAMFSYYVNNTGIYANILANGDLQIPSQVGTNIGVDNGAPCDVANHTFVSTSYTATGGGNFTLFYSDQNMCNLSSTTFETYWVKL